MSKNPSVFGEMPQLKLQQFWMPTRDAGERIMPMQTECVVNARSEEDPGLSMAEIAWMTGDIDRAIDAVFSFSLPPKPLKIIRRVLQPWPDGRYTTAYERTGGILNFFTPSWGESEDEIWAEMVAGWESTSFESETERQAALRALEQVWNTTPHPFFAGLSPAQVMVGGGRQEQAFAEDFLEYLSHQFEGRPFNSEGEALIQSLGLLRAWEMQRQADGRTIREVILAERTMLLARRAQALAKRKRTDP
jgi:hypothetical protein